MRRNRPNPLKTLKIGLHILMGFAYVLVGILIVVYKWFVVELELPIAIALGVLSIAYGLFRVYRGYSIYAEEE